MLFEAPDGRVADRHIRVLKLPARHLLRAPRLLKMPTLREGYRSSLPGAQPPPVPTVEVLVDNELGRLLQPLFSLVMERGEVKTSHPSPYNAVPRSSIDVCERSAHLPYGAYF